MLMNGLITNNCCCGDNPCCNVTGPAWANRYCFQMTGYEATYEFKECRWNQVDEETGPLYCVPHPEPAADTDAECVENSEVCHRLLRRTACAGGAIFRGALDTGGVFNCCGVPGSPTNPGCGINCEDGCFQWSDVCGQPVYSPPNVSVTGCDSLFTSPPCDCEVAGGDVATVRGTVQDLDLTGFCHEVNPNYEDPPDQRCIPFEDVDEPFQCGVTAILRCAEGELVGDQCPAAPYCASDSSGGLVRHYFEIGVFPQNCGCDGPDGPTTFRFEADLGPSTPPDQAEWTCVSAPAFCVDLIDSATYAVCEDADCGETYPEDPCGVKSCGDWSGCYTNSDNPECSGQDFTCRGCIGPSTLVLPTLTFSQYQQCGTPENC